MDEEFDKINSYLFQKYDKLVHDTRNRSIMIHDPDDTSIDILKLIVKYSTKNDDLYKLYEVFTKPVSYKLNLSKREYFDKYIKGFISNVYYKKVISKNVRFIIDLLDVIEDEYKE
jgi:hypothetical protein